jgi:D-sedoheptulose 7-phosphate isomerase
MKDNVKSICNKLFIRYPKLENCKRDFISVFDYINECYSVRGKLLVCGNGGSAADSQHIVGELMKGFMLERELPIDVKEAFRSYGAEKLGASLQGALPAISLVSETALITAISNDCESNAVFAQQVYGLMRKKDVLLCLSTSGNSENVVNAAITAKVKGGKVVSIVGANGGKLAEISDAVIKVPSTVTAEIQEYTLPIYHTLCAMLEAEYFDN